MDRLCTSVDTFYQEILNRLRILEHSHCQQSSTMSTVLNQQNMDGVSRNSPMSSSEDIPASNGPYGPSETAFGYAFDQDLQNSIVYRRIAFRRSVSSFHSRETHTTTRSILSGLSFADVSQISVIGLAITSEEVYKPLQYVSPATPSGEVHKASNNGVHEASKHIGLETQHRSLVLATLVFVETTHILESLTKIPGS